MFDISGVISPTHLFVSSHIKMSSYIKIFLLIDTLVCIILFAWIFFYVLSMCAYK